jgi:hypothetical protein
MRFHLAENRASNTAQNFERKKQNRCSESSWTKQLLPQGQTTTTQDFVCAGSELHAFMKTHCTAYGISGKRFLPVHHDGLDWQLRFFRMSSIDDSVEFTLFRENGIAASRRVL